MNGKKQRVTITLDPETIEQCDITAKSLGLSRSSYISFLINSIHKVTTESSIKPEDIASDLKTETEK